LTSITHQYLHGILSAMNTWHSSDACYKGLYVSMVCQITPGNQ